MEMENRDRPTNPPLEQRFFIALMPPQAIQDYANTVIQDLGDRYRTHTARCAPHVTLQPPFLWNPNKVEPLVDCLSHFASQHQSIPVQLSGFGAFPPRVLYLNVLKTPELLALQAALQQTLESTLGITDPKSKHRPFAPHLTVASRNFTGQTFRKAWAEYQLRPFEGEFVGDRLTLLIYRERWSIHSEFPLRTA